MKKGFLILAIGLWTLIAVAIISATILIANGKGNYMIPAKADTLIKDEEINLGNIEKIKIDSTSQSIQIRKTDGNSIKVSQYGDPDTLNEDLFLVSTTNDSLHIYFNKRYRISLFCINYNERLVVEIPERFYGDLDTAASSGSIKIEDEFAFKDVELTSSSGSIRIEKNITADILNASSSSGSIRFNGIVTAKDISAKASSGSIRSDMNIISNGSTDFNTSSGSIDIKGDISAKDLYAHSSSGGIHLSNVFVESYSVKCTSGSINIDSISGGGSAKTSSGGIRLALQNPKGDVDLNSTSGSIRVTLDPSLQFTLTARTTSGGIHTNFNINKNDKGNHATASIGDNPTVNITANASSGGIRVEN